MQQVKPFNPANGGTTKYMCLQNVRLGYSIPAYYSTAKKAWDGSIKHPDRNFPVGCSVPVYWSLFLTLDGVYADFGHVATRLADGRIWTDGRYYSSIEALNSGYLGGKGTYLGWSEDLNKVKVVGGTMAETINDDVSRQIGFHTLGRNGKDGKANALNSRQGDVYGKPLTNAQMSAFFLSAESRDWRDNRLQKVYAERDALKSANANLNTQITQLSKAVADKDATIQKQGVVITEQQALINGQKLEIAELADENAKLKAQLATCGDNQDTDYLNKLGEILRWLINRLGLKG